jgi:creatinine amidohydrolase
MTRPTVISEMSWVEFDNRIQRDNATVLLPIGSLEQHGPHSPVGSDEILTRLIAEEVARRANAVVAPSINYGVRSQPRTGGGNHFPGTISIRGCTLTSLLRDIICEFVQKGATRLMILDTHYENEFFVIEAIEEAMRELHAQHRKDFKIIRVRYFELLSQDVLNRLFPDGFLGWALEHAAVMTTSLHLFLTPKLADMSKAPTHPPIEYPPYDVFPFDPNDGTKTGCLSSPAKASQEKGRLVFESVVAGLASVLQREFSPTRTAVAG